MADFNFSTLFSANDKNFVSSVTNMKQSLGSLNKTFSSGEKTTKSYFSKLTKNNQLFRNMTKDSNRASTGIKGLSTSMKGLNMIMGAGSAIAFSRALYTMVQSTMDMVETANLFNVAMGDMSESTDEWVKSVSDATGLDTTNLRDSVATYSLLARSMGMSSEQSQVLATTTSQLALDLASLTNVPIEQVMGDLRSGLVGQSETMYKYGVDVTEASLKTEALAQGITKSVRNMSQGEKMALRYSVMLKQTGLAQGDFANTVDTSANQSKILSERLVTASRSIGSIFLPAIESALPYLNAMLQVVIELADALAKLFGYEEPVIEDTVNGIGSSVSDTSDDLDDASESADALKNSLMGFDEINQLSITDDSSDSDTSTDEVGGFDVDLSTYDSGLESIVSKSDAIAEQIKAGLSEIFSGFDEIDLSTLITSFEDLSEAMKPYMEGGAKTFKWFVDNIIEPFATWTINSLLPTMIDTITKAFTGLRPILRLVGIQLLSFWNKYLAPTIGAVGEGLIQGLEDLGNWFIQVGENSDEIKEKFTQMFKSFAEGYNTWIKPTVDTWGTAFNDLIENAINPLIDTMDRLSEELGIGSSEISTALGVVLTALLQFVLFAIRGLWSLTTNGFTFLLNFVNAVITMIGGLFKVIKGLLTLDGDLIMEGL